MPDARSSTWTACSETVGAAAGFLAGAPRGVLRLAPAATARAGGCGGDRRLVRLGLVGFALGLGFGLGFGFVGLGGLDRLVASASVVGLDLGLDLGALGLDDRLGFGRGRRASRSPPSGRRRRACQSCPRRRRRPPGRAPGRSCGGPSPVRGCACGRRLTRPTVYRPRAVAATNAAITRPGRR